MTVLSKQSVEVLIDLVDNKMTTMEVFDRDDRKEFTRLEGAMTELQTIMSLNPPSLKEGPRRGRPRKVPALPLQTSAGMANPGL